MIEFTIFDNVQNADVSSALQFTTVPNMPKMPEFIIPPLFEEVVTVFTFPPFAIINYHYKKI